MIQFDSVDIIKVYLRKLKSLVVLSTQMLVHFITLNNTHAHTPAHQYMVRQRESEKERE